MKFAPTPIQGVWRLSIERQADERGFFARSYCQKEFADHGIHDQFVQNNLSYNAKQHTLRGLHYQSTEHPESKVVRCQRGAIYDVMVDMRRESPSFKRWYGIELSDENRESVYIPPGVAHGFLTLKPETEVHYLMGGFYVPDAARGVRWNDPAFGIEWPAAPAVISERDANYPGIAW